MRNQLKKRAITVVVSGLLVFTFSADSEAFWFHTTRKAIAKRIMTRGINPAKFSSKARFGKGFYASRKPTTALAEKGKNSAVIRVRESAYAKKNTLNIMNPSSKRLHSLVGEKVDLRGTLRNGVVGQKIGRRVGRLAGKEGTVVQYRSARNGGSNYFVPKRLFEERPNIVRPVSIQR